MLVGHLSFVPGAPGGPELLIILFILFFVLVPVVVVAALAVLLFGRRSSTGEVDALRERVHELEREVEALDSGREAQRDEDR